MKLEDYAPAQPEPLSAVGIGLTLSEAEELYDKLRSVIDDPIGRHEHVSSADYQTEVTIFIVDDDGELLRAD